MLKQYIKLYFLFFFLTFIYSCSNVSENAIHKENKEIDSIYNLLTDKSFSNTERIILLDSIYNYATHLKNDTLKMKATEELAKLSYKQNKWDLFHKYKNEHIYLSTKYNDLYALAETYEYGGAYYMNHFLPDSAYYYYYNCYKIYENLNDSVKMGRILLNIAIIQKNTYDYTGSEASTFQALSYIKSNNNIKRISSLYNNLGLIYSRLNDFDNSIKYHLKALALRKQMKNNTKYVFHSLGNIGKAYKDNGQNDKAIIFFKNALKFKNYLDSNIRDKAIIIENYTHAQFKNGIIEGILSSYKNVLAMFNKENDIDGVITTCIHMSEYYQKIGNIKQALKCAEHANKSAKKIHRYKEYLLSLEILIKLQNNKEDKDFYFKKYIKVNDSLNLVAKKHKDKFARIIFETDIKNQTILKQKAHLEEKNNYIFILFSLILIIMAIILVIYIRRKKDKKNKKRLKEEFKNGFKNYLKKKYTLTNHNFEFWKIWIKGYTQEEIAQKLHLSINSVKSRRKSLKDRINEVEKIAGSFDKTKAIILYNKEQELYKKTISKQ